MTESVTSTYRIEVREPVERDARAGRELRNDAERWERGKFVVALVRPLQFFLSRANTEVVEDDIPFLVCKFLGLRNILLRGRDEV